MKLTIFAATGGIGRHLLQQAIDDGHDVTVVVRNPAGLPSHLRGPVREVLADLADADPSMLESAVAGADAVLSGLGPRRMSQPGIASQGTRAIVRAMQATGTRRIVVVSGARIQTIPSPGNPNPPKHDPADGFFSRHLGARLAKLVMGKHLADVAVMEDILRDSGLDYTIVRPPLLTDKPLTGTYRTAYGQGLRGGSSVARADVADYMLRALIQPGTVQQAIGIAS